MIRLEERWNPNQRRLSFLYNETPLDIQACLCIMPFSVFRQYLLEILLKHTTIDFPDSFQSVEIKPNAWHELFFLQFTVNSTFLTTKNGGHKPPQESCQVHQWTHFGYQDPTTKETIRIHQYKDPSCLRWKEVPFSTWDGLLHHVFQRIIRQIDWNEFSCFKIDVRSFPFQIIITERVPFDS